MNEARNGSPESRVWLITGASVGFGRSIVEEALRRGDRVVATARSLDSLADLASHERVLTLPLDVTQQAQIDEAVAAATAHFGRIDVLVNNAGYSLIGALEETSEKEMRSVMETMFFGAVALTRAVLPGMRERRSGTIVQITSVGGLTTAPGFGVYCAAKHALEGISECLSLELQGLGVRVLIVEPGAFRTALFGNRFRVMATTETYAATVGPVRSWATQHDGLQPGDPAKAAIAIAEALGQDPLPLRLPLGGDAVDAIRQKLAAIEADVARAEPVARATAFEGG